MELIDTDTSHSKYPHFRPLTPAQHSSCTPVVDYHYMEWGRHSSERFQTNTEFLGPTRKEEIGFESLGCCEFREVGNLQVGEDNGSH